MSNEKSIVITVLGKNKNFEKISVSLFDKTEGGYKKENSEINAEIYCNTINNLELKNDAWIYAKIISGNVQYPLDAFYPLDFDIISNLDNKAIQKILREVDSQDLIKALKNASNETKEKIFINMSSRAVQMLKEDLDFMGPTRFTDIKRAQEKIINIIRNLEKKGEIVISFSKGDIV